MESLTNFLVTIMAHNGYTEKRSEHCINSTYNETYILDNMLEDFANLDESWTFPSTLLFAMTTLTLIGYGHVSPSTNDMKLLCIVFTILGLPLTMIFLANIGGSMSRGVTYAYSRLCCRWCRVRRRKDEMPEGTVDIWLKVKTDDVGKEEYMPTKNVLVPLTVTLSLMFVYILFGAIIYVHWESGWTITDGIYFSFITLTTIGFGDLVPGSKYVTCNCFQKLLPNGILIPEL